MGSPGLYPRASSTLFNGSCPLNAVTVQVQKERSATADSHGDDRTNAMLVGGDGIRVKKAVFLVYVHSVAHQDSRESAYDLSTCNRHALTTKLRGLCGSTTSATPHLHDSAMNPCDQRFCFVQVGFIYSSHTLKVCYILLPPFVKVIQPLQPLLALSSLHLQGRLLLESVDETACAGIVRSRLLVVVKFRLDLLGQ
jgi:hypothetical protein